MTDTSTTHAARDHARSQAGAGERLQKTMPAGAATRIPDGIHSNHVLWEETVGPGNYAVRTLPRGSRLRLSDPDGDTSVQLLAFNAASTAERLNVADTVKIQWQAYLSQGQLLLSDMGRVLISIIEDSTDGHDCFSAMSNRAWNTDKFGSGALHGEAPNARDLFAVGLSKAGLQRRDVGPSVNLFKPIFVESDGTLSWRAKPDPQPGSHVTLRCEMDVLVALTVTPHVLDPRTAYEVTPLDLIAWTGQPTAEDDGIRTATPEGLRAFENTEDWILSRKEGHQ